jgi:hypothetical protein
MQVVAKIKTTRGEAARLGRHAQFQRMVHARLHAYTPTRPHIHTYTPTRLHTPTHAYIHACTPTHRHIHAYMPTRLHAYTPGALCAVPADGTRYMCPHTLYVSS